MANQGNPGQNTITTITDVNNNVIMEIRQEEFLVTASDGSITSYTHYRNIQLVDGSTWNPAMLWARPPVYIGVCESCRSQRSSLFRRKHRIHGLVAMSRAKICDTCGILTCPQHRKLSKRDKKWRCLSCAKKHALGNLLRPVFFEESEK